MSAALAALLGNPVELGVHARYAGIIGISPSKGARSPALWNAAFGVHGIDAEMLPMDVAPERLNDVVVALRDDASFLGGAVAAPYKGRVRELLGDDVDPDVRLHGSVNALYRDARGRLIGANTDGAGAARAIAERWPSADQGRIAVLGLGGVGRPVAVALAAGGAVAAASRSESDRAWCEAHAMTWVPWSERRSAVAGADLIVNCTSLGDARHDGESPLDVADLSVGGSATRVYDVIYQPAETPLLAAAAGRGLATCNGETMNLFQAELAFAKAFPDADPELTHRAMAAAFARL